MKNILLTNQEYPLIASPQLAKELGTAAATFLQKLHFLLSENRKFKQKKNLTTYLNRKWWFHTFEEWQTTLGMFSVSTIKRAVAKLKELGLIEINKLSKIKSIRVNYYAINYQKLKELSERLEAEKAIVQTYEKPAYFTSERERYEFLFDLSVVEKVKLIQEDTEFMQGYEQTQSYLSSAKRYEEMRAFFYQQQEQNAQRA